MGNSNHSDASTDNLTTMSIIGGFHRYIQPIVTGSTIDDESDVKSVVCSVVTHIVNSIANFAYFTSPTIEVNPSQKVCNAVSAAGTVMESNNTITSTKASTSFRYPNGLRGIIAGKNKFY